MPDQDRSTAPEATSAEGPGDLDMSLRQLIDVEGRAMALAKRAEQIINDPDTSPELRQKLIDGMDQVVESSDKVHRFVKETLSPSLTGQTPESSTAAPAPKRRKQKRPRVRL